ncbi:hypothetical protein IKF94_01705 [Candidatus Saccharibacteria bacterium]|nr:hypothetical protein [Candidatus Saccharibacteria bacterium]
MAEIVPTILTNDPEHYKKLITTFQPFAKRVQIDISDGTFAPGVTLPLNNVYWPKEWQVDFHMMVVRPSEFMPLILQLKPSLCIFHAEASENLLPLFEQLKSAGIKTGVAVMPSTFPGNIKQYLEPVNHILIFAGEIGKQGGEADMLQTEKVPLVKEINPNAEIGWDGGANLRNVRAIYRAGVDVINVGSAITTASDPGAMFEALVADLDKRGVVV